MENMNINSYSQIEQNRLVTKTIKKFNKKIHILISPTLFKGKNQQNKKQVIWNKIIKEVIFREHIFMISILFCFYVFYHFAQ